MLRGKALSVAIILTAGFEYLLVGYDQGLIGGIISGGPFVEFFNHPSSTMQGFIGSSYDVGSFFGAWLTYYIADPLGRKKCIIIGEAIIIVGTIIQVASYSLAQLIVGRIITGLGNGINSSTIPTWQSELVEAKSRGRSIVFETGILIAGVALSFWMGFATNFTDSSFQWRFPCAVQLIFAVAVFIAIMFLPETPRWLISHGEYDKALETLARVAGTDITDEKVIQEAEEIRAVDEHEKAMSKRAGIKDLFKKNDKEQNLRRMLLGMMPLMMNQISGINAPSYYLPLLLEESVGLSRQLSLILASCAATQYCVFSFLPIFYIDTFGRRKTMIWGSAGLSLFMALIAITNGIGGYACGVVTTVCFFLFFDVFGMSFLPVSWCYSPEINSLRYRGRGNAAGMATQWICNFLIVMITPVGVSNLQYKFYIIWAVINFAFIFMNWAFMVETAGRTLEEMDGIFERHPGAFATSKEEKSVGRSFDFVDPEQRVATDDKQSIEYVEKETPANAN
uniref:ARAD1D26840p n=1 Tax=Blastobotrys adeninivorans TaxID=409370 RepID=A0A060TGY5_BLAAD